MITVLAGGVGAARFLVGLTKVVDQTEIVVIGNTGDDLELYGLHISPDLDTVTYTVSGNSNPTTGWGLVDESWTVMSSVEQFGIKPWFNLGDRDLGTHLYRTMRLGEGASLSEVTAEIASSWGLHLSLLPMSNDAVRTRLTLVDGREVDFQEYFVRLRHEVAVAGVDFGGAAEATAAPGVLEAIASAEAIVIAPSNPILSIAPILAVPKVKEALMARRSRVVAVSPIVGGRALKGPADHLLEELGHESSVVAVARLYAELAATLVIDAADEALAAKVASCDVVPVVTETVMIDEVASAALATVVLGAAGARGDRQ